jgi:hypothetical protein
LRARSDLPPLTEPSQGSYSSLFRVQRQIPRVMDSAASWVAGTCCARSVPVRAKAPAPELADEVLYARTPHAHSELRNGHKERLLLIRRPQGTAESSSPRVLPLFPAELDAEPNNHMSLCRANNIISFELPLSRVQDHNQPSRILYAAVRRY